MKSKAGIFNFLKCSIKNRVIAFFRVYRNQEEIGVELLFLGGKMGKELKKRREVYITTIFHPHLCCGFHSHAQERAGFVEHSKHLGEAHCWQRRSSHALLQKAIHGRLMKADFIGFWLSLLKVNEYCTTATLIFFLGNCLIASLNTLHT